MFLDGEINCQNEAWQNIGFSVNTILNPPEKRCPPPLREGDLGINFFLTFGIAANAEKHLKIWTGKDESIVLKNAIGFLKKEKSCQEDFNQEKNTGTTTPIERKFKIGTKTKRCLLISKEDFSLRNSIILVPIAKKYLIKILSISFGKAVLDMTM